MEHVKRIEEEFYKSDRIIDVAVEKLEININPNSDSEMSDMSDLSESDDEWFDVFINTPVFIRFKLTVWFIFYHYCDMVKCTWHDSLIYM